MQTHFRRWYCLISIILLTPLSLSAREVPNFNLLDTHDKNHELYRADGKAIVLFFTGNGCTVASESVLKIKILKEIFKKQGINFWVINSLADESKEEIKSEIDLQGLDRITYLIDHNQVVALSYGVSRTAEVIAIDTTSWEVFYRGAVATEKPPTNENFLADALQQFIEGEIITNPKTNAVGCEISYAHISEHPGEPDYSTQVAPILQKYCVDCHRTGGIGPWGMTRHKRVSHYSAMIEEVLLTRRMPPWDPHPDYGHFKNDQSLTREEIQTLVRWIKAGSPASDANDPLKDPLPEKAKWTLGKPDTILKLPETQTIPATGIEPYHHLVVENPFREDVWLRGIDIKPTNNRVVHHAVLFAYWPDSPNNHGTLGTYMHGWAPGVSPLEFPEGIAKRLPANSIITIEMHYTTTGVVETDQTEVALYLAEAPIVREAETRTAINFDLDIPPGVEDAQHMATYAFEKPATIYGLFPHMHYRGKWMRYELLLPNGQQETLLHVPRYDFQWQLSYILEQPKQVPAGSWLIVTGSFDNSVNNPANPDPTKQVFYGEQSSDEMFVGFFEVADDPEPIVIR